MSTISNISNHAAYTPAVASSAPKGKAAPAATPAASPDAKSAPVAKQPAAQVATPAPNVISYRNADGDTVSITGTVLKDRDGDGGVGLPAGKPEAPASALQQKVSNAYSAS